MPPGNLGRQWEAGAGGWGGVKGYWVEGVRGTIQSLFDS